MPNVAHTYRQIWHGAINGSQDISFGWTGTYTGVGTGTPAAADVVAAMQGSSDLHAAEDALAAVLLPLMSPPTRINYIEYLAYGENPAVPAVAQHSVNYFGTGATRLPAEVACVVSMRSYDLTRSGRGRTYLPLAAMQLDTTIGGFDATQINTLATGVATYLDFMNNHTFAPSTTGEDYTTNPAVISTTHGRTSAIHSIVIDTRPDVQRRRQDKLPYVPVTRAIT